MYIIKTLFVLTATLLLMSAISHAQQVGQNESAQQTQPGNLIDVNVAIAAAEENLPFFYPGEWDYFTDFIWYDLSGEPAAYAIVFSNEQFDPNSTIAPTETISKIEVSMADARNRISSLTSIIEQVMRDSSKSGKEKNKEIAKIQKQINYEYSKYVQGEDSFATVITGAKDTMPVILKCHKGLPVSLVKKAEAINLLNKNKSKKQWEITNFLYLSPFDETFEAQSKFDGNDLSLESCVVDTRTHLIETKDDLHSRRKQMHNQKAAEMAKDPNLVVESQVFQNQNQNRWNAYRHQADRKSNNNIKQEQIKTSLKLADHVSEPTVKEVKSKPKAPQKGTKTAIPVSNKEEVDAAKPAKEIISKPKAPQEGTKTVKSVSYKEEADAAKKEKNVSEKEESESVTSKLLIKEESEN